MFTRKMIKNINSYIQIILNCWISISVFHRRQRKVTLELLRLSVHTHTHEQKHNTIRLTMFLLFSCKHQIAPRSLSSYCPARNCLHIYELGDDIHCYNSLDSKSEVLSSDLRYMPQNASKHLLSLLVIMPKASEYSYCPLGCSKNL